MSDLAYLEIDATAGLAEIELVIANETTLTITVGDEYVGAAGLQLGTAHTNAYYGDWGHSAYLHSLTPHAALNEPLFSAWLAQQLYLTEAPVDGNQYVRKSGQWVTITIPDEGVTNIFVEADPQFPIDYLKFTKGGQDYLVTDIPKADGVIYGGYVAWTEQLSFTVGPTAYYKEGNLYSILNSTINLPSADPTNPRIDIICVDINSQVISIQGVPSVNPQKPTPDPLTQIELTQVLIPAGATEPGDLTNEIVYNENAEWTGTSSGVTLTLNATGYPFTGTYNADVGAIGTGDTITFTSAVPINVFDYEVFVFAIKLKAAMANQHSLILTFYNGANEASNPIVISLNKSLVNVWQIITISVLNIQFITGNIDGVRFTWNKTGPQTDHIGFYLDLIKFEKGLNELPPGLQVATATDLNTGTDNVKYASSLALYLSEYQRIHVGPTPPADTTMLWLDTS